MTARLPWLLALACCVATGLPSEGTCVELIPPGREGAVLDLLKPYRDEGVVIEQVTLASVQIGGQRVVITLRDGKPGPDQPAEATVVLTPIARAKAGEPAFSTKPTPTTSPSLRRAQAALVAAIGRNDRGTFFTATRAAPAGDGDQARSPLADGATARPRDRRRPATVAAPVASLTVVPEAWLAALLWLILIATLGAPLLGVLARVMRGPRRLQAAAQVGAGVVLLLIALQGRLTLPFVPMHANHHAWEDLAVLLNLPQAAPAVGRHLEIYGASWLVARRAVLPLFGAHFDGVGLAGAWWGASALLLAGLAALRSGGSRGFVAVAALALAWAPVSARVAHSESDLVVGQWLLAAGLWLATREGRGALLGLAAAVALLALGHIVGPPLGLGLVLMAMAIRPAVAPPRPSGAPDRTLPAPSTHGGPATLLGGGLADDLKARVSVGAALLVALTGAAGLRLASAGAHVGSRLGIAEQAIPIPLQPWRYSLWLSPDHASTGLWVLALLGLAGAVWVRWADKRWRGVLVEVPLWVGVCAVIVTGLVVCASLTDGLRYQALLMAPALVLAGRAGLAWRHGPSRWRWAIGVACAIALTATVVETARGFAGRTQLDSQAQEWLHLRAALGKRTGQVYLLQPARKPGRAAVFEVPQGSWSERGPESLALDAAVAVLDCQRGGRLPAPTFAVRFAACSATVSGHVSHDPASGRRAASVATPAALCVDALSLRAPGEPLAALPVTLAQPLAPRGLPGEFLTFDRGEVPWQLFEARCPAPTPPAP